MQSPTAESVAMGQVVRGALAQAGLTQTAAAPLLDLSLITLSRRINGALPFTWPELVRVADITDLTVSELVAGAERILNKTRQVPA